MMPKGLPEDSFQGGIQVIGSLLAVLALDVAGDVVHRSRPVERHHGDDVLEGVGLQLAKRVPHTGALQLEHAGGISTSDHLEGGAVVEGQFSGIDGDAPFGQQPHRVGEHRQSLQAQKIELHQSGLFDGLMLNPVTGMSDRGSR